MKKTERNLLVIVSLLLVLLFVMSSTNLVLAEKKSEVYSISVLIDGDSSKGWDNFRIGVDKAAEKWNADVSFVTLYDKGNAEQQKQLLSREVENGADAIILSPADCTALVKAINDVPGNIPVIALGAGVDSPHVRSVISCEAGVMGAELGARIATDNKTHSFSQVVEVTYRQNRTDTDLLSNSLHLALPDHLPVERLTIRSEDEFAELMTYLQSLTLPTAVVATDSATLLTMAERLDTAKKDNLTLYGVGWSGGLLRYIESGTISDIGVYNDYDIGFLSVETALNALKGEQVYREYKVNQVFIPAHDIHNKIYEMLLFPIA